MLEIKRRLGLRRVRVGIGFLTCNFALGVGFCLKNCYEVRAETTNSIQSVLNSNSAAITFPMSNLTDNIMPVSIATVSQSGVDGTCNWDIDSNGKLTIHAGRLVYGLGTWSSYASSIKSVYVEPGVILGSYDSVSSAGVADGNNVFSNLPNVITIDVTNLDVSTSQTFASLFYNDAKLTQIIGLDTWDTSACTTMTSMFNNDKSLTSLDLSKFKTSNVTLFGSMFSGDLGLQALDVSGFDTSKATSMTGMFSSVPGKITGLNKFDVSSVTNMNSIFKDNDFTKTDPDDIKNWNISKVTSLAYVFQNVKFNSLDLSNWDLSNVTDMTGLFSGDSNIDKVKNIADWDVSKVTNMDSMFYNVTDSDLSVVNNWDVSNVTNMGSMFNGCKNLTSLDLSKWNTSSLSGVNSMFRYDKLLNEDNLLGYQTLVTKKASNMYAMFSGTGFGTIDLSQYDTSNVTNFESLFAGTSKLQKIIGTFDTSSATNFSSMFQNTTLPNFDGLNVADWDTSKVQSMANTFDGCGVKDYSPIKNWNTSSVTDLSRTFSAITGVATLPINDWDVSKVNRFYMTFYNSEFTELPIENWNTSSATNMYETFFGEKSVKNLNLSKWNTSKVTTFYAMFNSMADLRTLDISNFDTTKATDISYLFGSVTSNLWKVKLGPKMIWNSALNSTNQNLPSPVAGTEIFDPSTTEQYKAISSYWQEVDESSGGTDHAPVGDLYSNTDISEKFSTVGNPVTTFVWQQQPKIDIKMTVPDIDFGTVNNVSQVAPRKNSMVVGFDNNNNPAGPVTSTLAVSLAAPLTSDDGLNTMNNVLIYREAGKSDQILDTDPYQIYSGSLPNGPSSIDWDKDQGILLNLANDKHIVSGHYSTTLNWTLINSI